VGFALTLLSLSTLSVGTVFVRSVDVLWAHVPVIRHGECPVGIIPLLVIYIFVIFHLASSARGVAAVFCGKTLTVWTAFAVSFLGRWRSGEDQHRVHKIVQV
jgi:hypothetical protein